MERFLINSVYTGAVGHVIEGLMYANALRNANADAEIRIFFNRDGPLDLLRCAGPLKITATAVKLNSPAAALGPFFPVGWRIARMVGTSWDQALAIHDAHGYVGPGGRALKRFHRGFYQWAERARVPLRIGMPVRRKNSWAKTAPGPEVMSSPLRLSIPEAERRHASSMLDSSVGPVIGLLLGSAEPPKAPELVFWRELIGQLVAKWPEARIVVLGMIQRPSGQTPNVTRADLEALLAIGPQVRDGFDLGIVRQLALLERSHVLISPHSGMAFAAQCVGTPWLALSGWKYHEYLTNGVPFYSLHPDCPHYPCGEHNILPGCRERVLKGSSPVSCLSAEALLKKIPRIIEEAAKLVRRDCSYEQCIALHRANLARRDPSGTLGVLENIGRPRFRLA